MSSESTQLEPEYGPSISEERSRFTVIDLGVTEVRKVGEAEDGQTLELCAT